MSSYKVRIIRTESKDTVIEVDGVVNTAHAKMVAEIEADNIDFSDKSECGEPSYEYEVGTITSYLPLRARLWVVDPKSCHKSNRGYWNWSGLKAMSDEVFELRDNTDFVQLVADQIKDVIAAAHVSATMEVRYRKGAIVIVDPEDDYRPYFAFDILPEEKPETWKEWWRHISCHKCDECESMPGDEQRWHSQTFEYIHAFGGSINNDEPEELHGHGVYKCPSCGDYVVCELVEETMDENGIVEDAPDET